MFALTIDQHRSRRGEDLVPGLLGALAAVPTVLPFERTVGDEVQGLHGDAVKIRLRAPPADDRANAALVEFLAGRLGLPSRQVALVSGRTSRRKRVAVTGAGEAQVRARLGV